MFTLTWLAFALLSFAAFRITRFIAADLLIDGLRARLVAWAYKPDAGKVRGRIGDLFTCQWCVGFWVSGVLVLAWSARADALGWDRWFEIGVEWWAVAGAASVLVMLEQVADGASK